MTRMTVKHIKAGTNGDDAILVLQTADGARYLGFFVPMNEANRLARVLGMTGCRCSPIYDLLMALGKAVATPIGRAVLDVTPDGIGATLGACAHLRDPGRHGARLPGRRASGSRRRDLAMAGDHPARRDLAMAGDDPA